MGSSIWASGGNSHKNKMPPVVLPDEAILHEQFDDKLPMEIENDNDGQKPLNRRDSTGSTGYSTCSSHMSSVSHHNDNDRSPRSPDSHDEESPIQNNNKKEMADNKMPNVKVIQVKEITENEIYTENDNGNVNYDGLNGNDNGRKMSDDDGDSFPPSKLSAVDYVNQVCANQRCLSAGYKKRKDRSGLESLRRGSNGYNTSSEAQSRLVTPASVGEAITSVIQKLEENIEDLKINHEQTINQMKNENENKFAEFTEEQEKNIMKISENIANAEDETMRIKEQHDLALDSLKESILKVSSGNQNLIDEKEIVFNEKHEELHDIAKQHENFIKDLTSNLDRISNENKESVASLLANLEKAKYENEIVLEKHNRAINELKELQERSINDLKYDLETAKQLSESFKDKTEEKNQTFEEENIQLRVKLDYHETAIQALGNTLESVTEKNNEMHTEIAETHKKSLGELRQEVFSQVMVVKEISKGVQEEFNDKLETLSTILDDEKTSNKQKIEEVREALDGIDMDIKSKMDATTENLLSKIHTEVKQNGEGKYGIDLEISVVKDMLESLGSRVTQMNEKMYDFEQNKRNNLIFYGVPNDPSETSESLAHNMQRILKDTMMLKREIVITQASRDDTGPVIVTFENFKDRDAVLRRVAFLKKSNMHVTEDLSKTVREQRAHLAKFMKNMKKSNPDAYCFIHYDKLYIDNRLYVFDKEKQEVIEQDNPEKNASRPASSMQRSWSRPPSSMTRLNRSSSRPSSSAMPRSSSTVSLNRPKSVTTRLSRAMSVEAMTGNSEGNQDSLPLIPGALNRSPRKTRSSWQKILSQPFRLN